MNYKQQLTQFLDSLDYIDESQKFQCLANFDKLTKSGVFDGQSALERIKLGIQTVTKARYEATAHYSEAGFYRCNNGPIDTSDPDSRIMDALEEASKQKFIKDPVARCKRAIANFRKNISKVSGATLTSAFTGGHSIDILSADEIAGLARFEDAKDFSKDTELTRWNAYASQYHLK